MQQEKYLGFEKNKTKGKRVSILKEGVAKVL